MDKARTRDQLGVPEQPVGAVGQDLPMLTGGLLLAEAEQIRRAALAELNPKAQGSLGQFFTPARAAALLASMPELPARGHLRVLDPGAGSGMLSAAIVARVMDERPDLTVELVTVERDGALIPHLTRTLEACVAGGAGRVIYTVIDADYVLASTAALPDKRLASFDLVIQNPPYAKLGASSAARVAVRTMGSDTPNLYAAFLALASTALVSGGQLVAITPRSFCNGPYFGEFRSYLLDQISLNRIHVFGSRSTVFADSGVLQENVIFSGTKAGTREKVLLSSSNSHEDALKHRTVSYADVVHPNDPHRFIRITTNDDDLEVAERMLSLPDTLSTLGIHVSTGRVVDFRSTECLLTSADGEAVPLIYPGNIREGMVSWPREIRKPQWFRPHSRRDTKMVFPEGWYCVVKRFSAKEERRRIVSSVWSPEQTPGPVAFENHLNIFHVNGAGLDSETARGVSVWLNSSLIDQYFRTFSGHTQVNATDLRNMRFPNRASLRRLGNLCSTRLPDQHDIDSLVETVLGQLDTAA